VPERIRTEETFNVLGDVLETLRFRGTIFFRSELAAPWGMSLQRMGWPRFHIALTGGFFLGANDQEPVNVQESDIVMLPCGTSHWIADKPGRELVPSDIAGEACELGNPLFQQGEIVNRVMCGLVRFDPGSSHPVLDALPEVIHIASTDRAGPIWSVVKLIDAEMEKTRGHGSSIVDRLTEVLFLYLIHHYVETNEAATGFLAALRDRRVHRALTLIHREPEFDWTLATLGDRVGMSRATLLRRFQEVVGMSPMAYIMDWRIMKAHNLIKYTGLPLEQIAQSVGFASSRTLSRAFQRHYGCTPNEIRRSVSAR
jgi:AraC-like DNA-binding protein